MKELNSLVSIISKLSGIDNLHISYASCYGGYRLVIIGTNNCERTAFNGPNNRMTKKEFTLYLNGVIDGLSCKLTNI